MEASRFVLFFVLLPIVITQHLTSSPAPDMTSILNHVTQMKQTITALQTQVKTTDTELSTVKDRLVKTEDELVAVKAELKQTQQNSPDPAEFANLKSELESLKTSHNADVRRIQSEVRAMSADVNITRQNVSQMGEKIDMDVAFQVSHSHTVGFWTTLKFDTVAINVGGAYNAVTGMFTAPISGTYIFWADVTLDSPVGDSNIFIYKGQSKIATGFARLQHTSGAVDIRDISVMTVTHVDKGEQIHFGAGSYHADVYGHGVSTYGGALIHAS